MTLTFVPKIIAVFVAGSPTTSIVGEMVLSPEMTKRRIGEGAEFFRFPCQRQATER